MLIPSYATIKEEFNLMEAVIGIPDSFFILISAGFALIWGYFSDRLNRTRVILAGAFSWTLGMLVTAFSYSFSMLIISRALSGAGLGCVLPVGYSILSDVIPPDERSGWFGAIAILSSVSNGIGQGLSSFLGPILTWRFPFLLLSGISIVVIFLLFFIKIPQRGAREKELVDLSELNLEYSYKISTKDITGILNKKTNRYLIIQGFFAIIPGTILVYFLTSMLTLHYFNEIPAELRLQTATIFAGMVGVGYILGNVILSNLGDFLFRKNERNRTILATVCMFTSIPAGLIMLFFIQPIDINKLGLVYPNPIETLEIGKYIGLTIIAIFQNYPSYIYMFVFALIASVLSAGPVANKSAVMIDVNLPEHKGTAASLFKLSEQVGKGLTILITFILISFLGSIFNMIVFSMIFWLPAGILWFFASKTVITDMRAKSKILSERQQSRLIDYIFELEIQMDRAIQFVQDSKFYIITNKEKFRKLVKNAQKIFKFVENQGRVRSMTNIQEKASIWSERLRQIRMQTSEIYRHIRRGEPGPSMEKELHRLNQIRQRIGKWEKSTFGTIQTYYEVAHLKIVEARLMRNYDLLKCLSKVYEAIRIYHRVKHLLQERVEHFNDKKGPSEEDIITNKKESVLLEKCVNALNATVKLKDELEAIFDRLEEKGITRHDLLKISELTFEYQVDLRSVLVDTFGQDEQTRGAIIETLEAVSNIFTQYDSWRETEFRVF